MIDADLEFDGEFEDEEDCPYSQIFLSLLTMPKPLGLVWELDAIEDFLKKRGYKVIKRTNSSGDEIKIAIKPEDSLIPENETGNLREVFYDEVQRILLNWLLKIGSEN